MNSLVNKVGEIGQDNLIAKLSPEAEAVGGVIAALEAEAEDKVIKRGTLLGTGADGKLSVFAGSVIAKEAKFNGDGSAKTFTVSDKPETVTGVKVGDTNAVIDDYNAFTGVVTLHTAPAAGTNNVVVSYELSNGLTPSYILADDVVATADGAVTAVVYRCGNFNRAVVEEISNYTLTEADRDALRKYGIIFTDCM